MKSRRMRMMFAAFAVTALLAVTLTCAGCRARGQSSNTAASPKPNAERPVATEDSQKPVASQATEHTNTPPPQDHSGLDRDSVGNYQISPVNGKSLVTDVGRLVCSLNELDVAVKSFPDPSGSPDKEFEAGAERDILQLKSSIHSESEKWILRENGETIVKAALDAPSNCVPNPAFQGLPAGKTHYLLSKQDGEELTSDLIGFANQLNALAQAQNQLQETFGNADLKFARTFDDRIRSLGKQIGDTQVILYGMKLPGVAAQPIKLPKMVAVNPYKPVQPGEGGEGGGVTGFVHTYAASLVLLLVLMIALALTTLSVRAHKQRYEELNTLLGRKEAEVTRLQGEIDAAKREVEAAKKGYEEARDACLIAKDEFEQATRQTASERDTFLEEYRREAGEGAKDGATSTSVTPSAQSPNIPIGKPKPGEGTHIPGNPETTKEAQTMSSFAPPPASPEPSSGLPREPIPTGDPLKDYTTARAMDLSEGESWFCRNYDTKGISCKNLETYGSISSPKLLFELNKRGVFLGVVFQKYLLAFPSFSYDYTARKAMEGVYVYPAGGGAPTRITQPAVLDASGEGWVINKPGVFQ